MELSNSIHCKCDSAKNQPEGEWFYTSCKFALLSLGVLICSTACFPLHVPAVMITQELNTVRFVPLRLARSFFLCVCVVVCQMI